MEELTSSEGEAAATTRRSHAIAADTESDEDASPEEKQVESRRAEVQTSSEKAARSDGDVDAPPRALSPKSELVRVCPSLAARCVCAVLSAIPAASLAATVLVPDCGFLCAGACTLRRASCCAGGRSSTNGSRQLASNCVLLLTLTTCGWTETGDWTLGSGSALG